MKKSVHIPYSVNHSRWFEYEQRWKEAAVDLINKHMPVNKRADHRVLDFGCGRGEFLKLLSDNGYSCEGVDFDSNCVKLSSKFAITHLADEYSIVNLFKPKSFDVVTAIHVLEHAISPFDFVQRIKHLSRKYLLLAVPNLQGTAYLPLRGRLYDVNRGHICGWDHTHFKNFIMKLDGLELVEFAHDTVVFKTYISKLDRLLDRTSLRRVVRKLETGWLLRTFPYLSHSIIALCKVVEPDRTVSDK